jgi:NAD(P)-dependent dehydrogenase (short-subunit alcohol dehydrogenase family)
MRRIALITGAAKRIGRAISAALASQGFDIGVHYGNSRDEALSFVAELEFMGVRAHALQADLADPEQVETLFTRTIEALGPVQVLVNNASIFLDDRFETLDAKSFLTHFQTNTLAPLLLSKAMKNQDPVPNDACIINLIDQRILRPLPGFISYGLSKAALHHATTLAASELAPNIRVNAIGPGPIIRSIHQTEDDFRTETLSTPLQRQVWPEEVAEAVLYLVNAHSVTGQMICVDSGQHLN